MGGSRPARRWWAALGGVAAAAVVGYAALDIADVAPGVLTLAPEPPPPPTETVAVRTLPVVPQPTASTSGGMPLGPLAGATAAPSPAALQHRLTDVLRLPALSDASLVVRDGQSGTVLFDHGGAAPRVPASTTKLLSAAAVGQVFDAGATLHTEVVEGATEDSIILVAGGDSLLAPGAGDAHAVVGHAGLGDLAEQVAQTLVGDGVRRVTVAVDLSYAPGPLLAPTWAKSFRPDGITGAVAMLGRSDQRALPGRPGPADPVAGTLDAFIAQLSERGVKATLADSEQQVAAPGARVLGSVESAPVHDQLALALTESDNALVEILARQAAFRAGTGTTVEQVGSWVADRVATLGVPRDNLRLLDASGLTRDNRVTALALTDLLLAAYDGHHPQLREAVEGMPIAGLTGTLADRYLGEDSRTAAGRVRAKTGTLTGANSIAGVVVDDDGRLLVYAGLVAEAPILDARAALDEFVAALASCGCRS
jgi:D-alanyl-D-alanine carboxypeptidase/D-alanyl-D-alanine-endopeptidase (penicillin-binding protein 4)